MAFASAARWRGGVIRRGTRSTRYAVLPLRVREGTVKHATIREAYVPPQRYRSRRRHYHHHVVITARVSRPSPMRRQRRRRRQPANDVHAGYLRGAKRHTHVHARCRRLRYSPRRVAIISKQTFFGIFFRIWG
jgi:hypothetical protein